MAAPGPTTPSRWHRLAASRTTLWIALAWGFAEATLFFVVPDVWLGFIALFAPFRVPRAFVAVLVGAMAGSLVLWWLAPVLPLLGEVIAGLPAIGPAAMETARRAVTTEGLPAMVNLPFQGPPLKVYVHAAALAGSSGFELLLFVVLNRIARIVPLVLVAVVFGVGLRGWIARHATMTLVTYALVVSLGYLAYWASGGASALRQ